MLIYIFLIYMVLGFALSFYRWYSILRAYTDYKRKIHNFSKGKYIINRAVDVCTTFIFSILTAAIELPHVALQNRSRLLEELEQWRGYN